MKKQGQLYVFGDPLQSIYSFRGANFDAFIDIAKLSPTVKEIILTDNYRSRQDIIDLAHLLFPESPKLLAMNAGNAEIKLIETNSEYSQAHFIADNIEQGIAGFDLTSNKIQNSSNQNNNSFKDYAVIFRMNQQAEIIKKVFMQKNIPFQTAGEGNIFENSKIKLIIALLNFCLKKDYQEIFQTFPKSAFTRISNLNFLNSSDLPLKDKYKARLENLLNHNLLTINDLIAFLVKDWELAEYFVERPDIWQEFTNLTANCSDLSELLAKINELIELNNYDDKAEKVTLITMHSVKGLEFKHVYVCGFNEGVIPVNGIESQQIEEEKRLLYVALTRAKESLTLFYLKNLGPISRFYENLKGSLPVVLDPLGIQYEKKKAVQKQKKSQLTML